MQVNAIYCFLRQCLLDFTVGTQLKHMITLQNIHKIIILIK